MTAPVFLVTAATLADLSVGDEVTLDGPEGRHAFVVQRRRVGERIDLVDGAGTRASTRIAQVTGTTAELVVESVTYEAEPTVRISLAQALAKGDRDELAISAATEVGVDEIVPWQADRSIVVWRGDRAAKSRARWHAAVDTATKQSRRARRPVVHTEVDTNGLVDLVQQVAASLVLDADATKAFADLVLPTAGTILVIVGPEGGISEEELTALTTAGAQPVRLGPHVLRTSTAGPIAIALLAERLGRWA
jgi:16S rRNA (uracil1498-N3)-methyltransferase